MIVMREQTKVYLKRLKAAAFETLEAAEEFYYHTDELTEHQIEDKVAFAHAARNVLISFGWLDEYNARPLPVRSTTNRTPPPCDNCGDAFPPHQHLCLECTGKAASAAGLIGRVAWALFGRLTQGAAVCPSCKTPMFLSKPLGRWDIR